MFNYLTKTDKEFHWTKAYSWYSDLRVKDIASRHLRTIGLVKVECMPKVFGVPKLASWCAKNFVLAFHKMLRFPKPNKELKLPKVDDFITNHGVRQRLLPHLTDSFFGVMSNSFQFDINILKDLSREFASLFAWVIG